MTEFAIPGLMPIDAPTFEVTPKFLELSPHSASNSLWVGIASIGPVTINEEPPPYPASRVIMELVPQIESEIRCIVLDSEEGGDGTINIVDAATWYFGVPAQALPAWPGLWAWKITVIDSRGEAFKPFQGQLLVTP